MEITINIASLVELTNKLEKMHRSVLPSAVRGALNKAAFDVKQNTMPKAAADTFTIRQPNFFKANSRVDMATGWNIKEMESTVGFTEKSLRGDSNYAVQELEQQERGGVIGSRSFIPTKVARGGSGSRLVKPMHRLSRIKRIINSEDSPGKTSGEKFVRAVIFAGKGGYVIGSGILWKVNSITRLGDNTTFKAQPIYSFDEGRRVRVQPTQFMQRASLQTGANMDKFYVQEAERQIKRIADR